MPDYNDDQGKISFMSKQWEDLMPVINIDMWEGRTADQKRKIVKAVTEAMVESAGVNPEGLTIIIHDIPKDSWARAGELACDK